MTAGEYVITQLADGDASWVARDDGSFALVWDTNDRCCQEWAGMDHAELNVLLRVRVHKVGAP